jgi:hypothetical protein
MSLRGLMIAAAGLVALAGCDRYTGSEIRKYTSSEHLQLGWARQDIVVTDPPRYCYRTLAAIDCYTQPQSGQDYRYVAPYAPVPTVVKPIAP